MSTLLLPDAPRANKSCRICQLIAVDESWAKLLYVYRFDKKMRLRDLVTAMVPHIEEWNKVHSSQLLPFSIKAASKHFTKHVPTQIQMQYEIQNKTGVARRNIAEQAVSPAITQQMQAQVNRSVAVFDELQSIFLRLKTMFEEYYTDHPKVSPMTAHLEIIREMRKTLAEISKMRQSKELVRIAVRSVIDTFLTKVVEDSGHAVDVMRDKLVKKCGVDFANEITEEFRKAMVDNIIEGARVAIDRVRNEFALDDQE